MSVVISLGFLHLVTETRRSYTEQVCIHTYFLHLTFLSYFSLQSALYIPLSHSSANTEVNPQPHLQISFQFNILFSERVMELTLGAGTVHTCVFIQYST